MNAFSESALVAAMLTFFYTGLLNFGKFTSCTATAAWGCGSVVHTGGDVPGLEVARSSNLMELYNSVRLPSVATLKLRQVSFSR